MLTIPKKYFLQLIRKRFKQLTCHEIFKNVYALSTQNCRKLSDMRKMYLPIVSKEHK